AENAARKIDAEKLRIPAPILGFGFLQRNTADRARRRAQGARHAALFAVGIARQHDTPAIARRQVHLLLGVLNRVALAKPTHEDHVVTAHYTANSTKHCDQHCLPSPAQPISARSRITAPVTSKLSKDSGRQTFQPASIT